MRHEPNELIESRDSHASLMTFDGPDGLEECVVVLSLP